MLNILAQQTKQSKHESLAADLNKQSLIMKVNITLKTCLRYGFQEKTIIRIILESDRFEQNIVGHPQDSRISSLEKINHSKSYIEKHSFIAAKKIRVFDENID